MDNGQTFFEDVGYIYYNSAFGFDGGLFGNVFRRRRRLDGDIKWQNRICKIGQMCYAICTPTLKYKCPGKPQRKQANSKSCLVGRYSVI